MYRCQQEPSIGLKLTKKVEFAKYKLIEVYSIRLVILASPSKALIFILYNKQNVQGSPLVIFLFMASFHSHFLCA